MLKRFREMYFLTFDEGISRKISSRKGDISMGVYRCGWLSHMFGECSRGITCE